MKAKILSILLSAGMSFGAYADDVFFGHYSVDPTIGTMFTKLQPNQPYTYFTFQEVFKDFTAAISLNPALLGNSVAEGWGSNVNTVRYGVDIYNNINKVLISSYVFDDPNAVQTIDLKKGTVVSYWFENSNGEIINANSLNIREYSFLAINAGDANADILGYAFYAYGDKTKTPLAVITMGDASRRSASPAGQPMPGVLASTLLGAVACFACVRFMRRKK